MDIFRDNEKMLDKIDGLYSLAWSCGEDWVRFLDLCFDGGDSPEEAEGLLMTSLAESGQTIEEVLG